MTIREIVRMSIQERIQLLKALKTMEFPTSKRLKFSVSDFRHKTKIQTQLDRLSGNKNVVYMIRAKTQRMSPEQILEAFDKWKSKNARINLSMLNRENVGCNKKCTLYVGSKETGFGSRIRQHIGTDNRRTYALHLKDWFRDKTAIIEIEYLSFAKSIERPQLQMIEDSLWDHFQPLFGKRGPR